MRKGFIWVAALGLLAACNQPERQGFALSGTIGGLQPGDTLLLATISLPVWEEEKVDTVLVEREGEFSSFVSAVESGMYLLKYRPKVGEPPQSCMGGSEFFARVGDRVHLSGDLKYLGALPLEGGVYDNPAIARYDSMSVESGRELIDIFGKITVFRRLEQPDSVQKYSDMYNVYRAPDALRTLRDSIALQMDDNEYSAYLYTSCFLPDATYETLGERVSRFMPEVRESHFGRVLDAQLKVLERIAVGHKLPDFTLTDRDGKAVSLSGYRGKYVLLYHWGLCPYTFLVDPVVRKLYGQYHDRGFEVLGLMAYDVDPLIDEERKHTEPFKSLLAHPWRTVRADAESNRFIKDELYLAGVPILMLIGPDGTTLVRGYADVAGEIEKGLAERLR